MEIVLQSVGERDVEHDPATDTDQVVVMGTGDVLGQFETGMVVGGDDSMDDPGLFQNSQVPVGGTLSQDIITIEQLGDGGGGRSRGQKLNDGTTIAGVALVESAKALQSDLV